MLMSVRRTNVSVPVRGWKAAPPLPPVYERSGGTPRRRNSKSVRNAIDGAVMWTATASSFCVSRRSQEAAISRRSIVDAAMNA